MSTVIPQDVRPGVKVYSNLDYAGAGSVRQMLDLFVPSEAKAPVPLILWFHGGGWYFGDKADPTGEAAYTARGYAWASVNYRYTTGAIYPANIEDCKAAVRYLRANAAEFNLDAGRFGAMGISAGGHLAALLGTSGGVRELEGKVGGNVDQSSRVQAVVNLCGPTDLTLSDQPPVLVTVIAKLIGGKLQDHKDLAVSASPLTYVTKGNPPVLNIHGQLDDIVPVKHAELFHEAFVKAGVDSTLIVLKDTGHGGGLFEAPQTRKTIADFFDKHLNRKL